MPQDEEQELVIAPPAGQTGQCSCVIYSIPAHTILSGVSTA
ncbi:hypothetical protein SRCM101294_00560 [Bacillus amyloliquefaciens]|nr:hypothetical protein SRCM101294_00560 [Bacillus amyloliquefaciens]